MQLLIAMLQAIQDSVVTTRAKTTCMCLLLSVLLLAAKIVNENSSSIAAQYKSMQVPTRRKRLQKENY